jgi:ABC transporter DrrB family efflux protein
MSAVVTGERVTTAGGGSQGTRIGYAVSDAVLMTKRNLLRYVRIPTLLVFSTIQPVMFVLLFRYVFGGAIDVPGPLPYVDFLMPGIFIQTVVFGSTQTGVGLAEDLSKGLVDRFRSLPMARSAVLAGRTFADTARNAFVLALMTAVGVAVGFRFHSGVIPVLGAFALALLFSYAFSWISALIGLAVRDVESTQVAGFVWIFPLTFASSAFVPAESMPDGLQQFANANPFTTVVDAVRSLWLGTPANTDVWMAFVWCFGLIAVFAPLAVSRYRHVAAN